MSRGPGFGDLVGPDVPGVERERLHRAHELLVEAGPPPELPPALESGPTLAMTLRRRPGARRRRMILLAAGVAAVVLVFLAGYITGDRAGGGSPSVAAVRTLQLRGTASAPDALASLRVYPADGGNWTLTLTVTGLPAPGKGGHYEVDLVRGGKPLGSCGTFVVAGPARATTVTLNAPYQLRASDTWVVIRQSPGSAASGQPVLRPAA